MKRDGPCPPNASATSSASATTSRPCQTAPNAVSIRTPRRMSASTNPLHESAIDAASSASQTRALSAARGMAIAAILPAAGARARAKSGGANAQE